MADITLSKAVRSNLLNLQSTAQQLGKTQERLATGLKVNSALDNPTNFFTASSLNSRASDLSQLLDSVSNAVQTISAADQGISAITKLVESAQATARQAIQSPATIDQTTPAAAATATGTTTGLSGTDTIDGAGFADSETLAFTSAGFDPVSITFTNTGGATSGATLDITATTVDQLITEINTQAGATVASLNADGAIEITGTNTTDSITFTGTNSAGLGSGLGTVAATAESTASVANPKRDELREQYNELLGQIDQLVADAGFNGVNLLNGDDLSVLFNEDGSSSLDITGVTFDSSGLGLSELSSGDFDTDADINSTLTALKSGIDTLRTQASKFGSNLSVVETRQDFTNNMINVLETGAANLTLADTNEEAANLLALQTRQQLSSTALSLASQADQQVLRLF